MSTFTLQNKIDTTPLDGPNDLKPVVKTSFMVKAEDKAKEVLQRIINTAPSELNYIEDSHYIHEAKNIWNQKF